MHLRPLPDVTAERLSGVVDDLLLGVRNARTGGSGGDLLVAYQTWARLALELLTPLLPPRHLEELVATPWYWALYSRSPGMDDRLIAPAGLELAAAEARFARLAARLRHDKALYAPAGHQLVPDTNAFLHSDRSAAEMDWRALSGAGPGEDLVLFIPLLVIDELDNAKQSNKKNEHGAAIRTVARAALRDLQRALLPGHERRLLQPAPAPPVYVQLVPDPPGHRRLSRPDDELIDVAEALVAYTGRAVTLVSRDAGARFRGELAGLPVLDPSDGSEGDLTA